MIVTSFYREQIKEIAEKYSNEDVSRFFFMEKYGISEGTFYSILEKAVIEHIVTLETVKKMKQRSIKNVRRKMQNDLLGNKTILHYDELIEKRKRFLFSKSTRLRILKSFSERDLRESKVTFCKKEVFDVELLDKILIFTIVHNELPKKIYSKIKENSLTTISDTNKVNKFFNLLDNIKKEIESGKDFEISELYKRVCNAVYPKEINITKEDSNNKNYINEDGDIVDDGYSIIDD